jgi:hypothetical protein
MVKCTKCGTEYDPIFLKKCPNPKCKQTILSWAYDYVGDIVDTADDAVKVTGDLIGL